MTATTTVKKPALSGNLPATPLSTIRGLVTRGHSSPTATIINLDAESAQYLLTLNLNNRPLRASNMNTLKNAIERREWLFNGSSVVVSSEDVLLDGQHRLSAIIHTKIICPVVLVTGAEQVAFATIDQGRRRTLGDMLGVNGPTGDPTFAATARLLYMWYHHPGSFGDSAKNRASMTQLVAFAERLTDLGASVEVGRHCKRMIGAHVSPSLYAAAHYEASMVNGEEADEFFEHLATGANLAATSPILCLRNAILRLEANKTSASAKMRRHVIALMAKAWNAWRDGKTMKVLRFTSTEDFPEFL